MQEVLWLILGFPLEIMIEVPNYISPQEYLAIERQSQIRHEYRRGLVYAMAGGTDNHERIAFNFLKVIDEHFGDSTDCRFHSGNVKVNYTLDVHNLRFIKLLKS